MKLLHAIRLHWIVAALMFCPLVPGTARADDNMTCAVCGTAIEGKYTKLFDLGAGAERNVCEACTQIKNRCFVCALPVKNDLKILPDGRVLCSRDAKIVVSSEERAKDIAFTVPDDLDRLLSRYLTIPATNVMISIVNRFYLDRLSKTPMAGQSCVTVFGSTATLPVQDGNRVVHTVSLLSDMKKSRLQAVSAHEFAHAWMGENISLERKSKISTDAVEGFCELIAYKYMESLHEDLEMEIITRNNYTKGQVNVLQAADARYGFNAVVEWIKNGEDREISMTNLDRIRAIQGEQYHAAPVNMATLFNFPKAAPTPVPDKLTLKGISGAAGRRLALINDATLAPMERGKVRVGQTNVVVRCLEIRASSVLIQMGDSPEKQELFLRTD